MIPAGCLKGLALCLFSALVPAVAAAQVLEQLIFSALASHPSVQSRRAMVDSAQAEVGGARWQFFPTASVSVEAASASQTDRLYQGDNRVSTLRLQQPLWTGGRLTAGMEKAEASLLVSEHTFEEVRQQLAVRVVQAYGDWLAAHLKVQANEKSFAAHQRLRQQVIRRIGEGVSAESDLTLAVARLEAISADVSAASALRDIALARLRQLLGRPVDIPALGAAVAVARPVTHEAQTLLDLAMTNNPGIQKALAQTKVQASVIDERRADLSPDVYVRVERQYGSYAFGNAPPENRVFVGLSTRFGAGLSAMSNVEAAKNQHRAALADEEVQVRAINEQVLSDYAQAISLVTRMSALKASLEAARQVAESYDRQFLAGRKSWLDLMNAARELAQTETQLADVEAAQLVASWRLAIATEGIVAVTGGAH